MHHFAHASVIRQAMLARNAEVDGLSFEPPRPLNLEAVGTVRDGDSVVQIFNEPIPPANGDFHVNDTSDNRYLEGLQGYDANQEKREKAEVEHLADMSAEQLITKGTGGRLNRIDSGQIDRRLQTFVTESTAATQELRPSNHLKETPAHYTGRVNTAAYTDITRPVPQTKRNTERDSERTMGRVVRGQQQATMEYGTLHLPTTHARDNRARDTSYLVPDGGQLNAQKTPVFRPSTGATLPAPRPGPASADGNAAFARDAHVKLRHTADLKTQVTNAVDSTHPRGLSVPELVLPKENSKKTQALWSRQLHSQAMTAGETHLSKDASAPRATVPGAAHTAKSRQPLDPEGDSAKAQKQLREKQLHFANFVKLEAGSRLPLPDVHVKTESGGSVMAGGACASEVAAADFNNVTRDRRQRFAGVDIVHVPAS